MFVIDHTDSVIDTNYTFSVEKNIDILKILKIYILHRFFLENSQWVFL